MRARVCAHAGEDCQGMPPSPVLMEKVLLQFKKNKAEVLVARPAELYYTD
jgi:hypothetical protein